MSAFAIYRLPHSDEVVMVEQTDGDAEQLTTISSLNGREGYVVAPFVNSETAPLLLIRPDRVECYTDLSLLQSRIQPVMTHLHGVGTSAATSMSSPTKETYAIDFANFHSQLVSGAFRKIVLARRADVTTTHSPLDLQGRLPKQELSALIRLFCQACKRYPRMFVSLVATRQSGVWLTATPEVLLESEGGHWHTVALAGTMRLEGQQLLSEGEHLMWSTKNIQEQRYVSTYITKCLEQFSTGFHEEGPYTVRAANLVHLRSDFTFSLPDDSHLGDVLSILHPTPAVCGLPKAATLQFISTNEHSSRLYYSGFMGPLRLSLTPLPSTLNSQLSARPPETLDQARTLNSPLDPQRRLPKQEQDACPSKNSKHSTTHLYVSLRCMNIEPTVCHLFAGGGIMPGSTLEQEWQETEAKLDTMLSLLNHKEDV